VTIARRVAHACAQPHEVIPVGEEFLSRFSSYVERTMYMTDGTSNVTHAADLYANVKAAQIARIRMTGTMEARSSAACGRSNRERRP